MTTTPDDGYSAWETPEEGPVLSGFRLLVGVLPGSRPKVLHAGTLVHGVLSRNGVD